jgi:hypothetical protein
MSIIFREMNEWTRDTNEAVGGSGDASLSTYLGECSDRECTEPISLTLSEYEGVRAFGTRFAIALDHENPEIEHRHRRDRTLRHRGEVLRGRGADRPGIGSPTMSGARRFHGPESRPPRPTPLPPRWVRRNGGGVTNDRIPQPGAVHVQEAAPLAVALAVVQTLCTSFGAVVETVDIDPSGCGEILVKVTCA